MMQQLILLLQMGIMLRMTAGGIKKRYGFSDTLDNNAFNLTRHLSLSVIIFIYKPHFIYIYEPDILAPKVFHDYCFGLRITRIITMLRV